MARTVHGTSGDGRVRRPRGHRAPVMSDVARLAGVSHQTVSRVLNDPAIVHPATRARVEQAIQELGYRRNPAARSLVTGRSQTLGVVTFETTLYGPSSTLYGLERAAEEAGYFVSIASVRVLTPDSMTAAVDRLVAQSVDGLVVIVPQKSSADALRKLPPGLPVVAVEGNVVSRVSNVAVDQLAGARLAVEHLLALGHTTVHHVRGPGDWIEADAREEGWRQALRDARRRTPRVIQGDWTAESGFRAGQELARRTDVTAVFMANDQMALGALRAFHESGVRVPEDLSVVGFDDIPEAGFLIPPLTTVRQDFDEVGRRSIELLLSHIDNPKRRRSRSLVPPRLVLRATTAPPRKGPRVS